MIYKIAVCDDMEEDLQYLTSAVANWAKQEKITVELEKFFSSDKFIFRYTEQPDFDILLLDIEMPGMNGIELAKIIRQKNEHIQIIFITGFPDFIAQGYDVSALHYLMKPVSQEKLSEILCRATEKLRKVEKTALFQTDGGIQRIFIDQIVSVEAFAHTCVIVTTNSNLEIKASISSIEKMLHEAAAGSFIRTHRSYLVGVRYIQSISKTDITLDSGRKIPLSRSHYQSAHQAFIHYFKGDSTWD